MRMEQCSHQILKGPWSSLVVFTFVPHLLRPLQTSGTFQWALPSNRLDAGIVQPNKSARVCRVMEWRARRAAPNNPEQRELAFGTFCIVRRDTIEPRGNGCFWKYS